MNEEAGLSSNIVYEITPDRDGGIWIASLQGISRLTSSRPAITVFDERLGLKGVLGDPPVRHNGVLYIQTTKGVFYLDHQQSKFVPVAGLNGELWHLFENKGSLYAVKKSLRKITGSGSTLVKQLEDRVRFVRPSWLDSNRIYLIFLHGEFRSLVKGRNGWREELTIPVFSNYIFRIAETRRDDFWLGTANGGMFRLRFSSNPQKPEIHYFDTEDGLPTGEISPFRTSWGVKFASSSGIYHFDESAQRFAPDTTFGKSLADGSRGIMSMAEDNDGNIWFAVIKGSNYYLNVSRRQPNGSFLLARKPFMDLPSTGVWMFCPEANGIFWFGGEEGLFRYDDKVRRNKEADFPALVRRVIVNEDSVIYDGNPPAAKRVELAYSQNSLRFECAATSLALPSANRFQFFLEGFDKAWSGWTLETKKDYTHIPEGRYTFRVRAQNVYEQLSNEDHYTFVILPPWYRTWWAYTLYGLAFFAVLYAVRQYEMSRQQFKHEAELQKIEAEQLQETDALKSRFFSTVSHEFRTPLTLIMGQIDTLLAEETLDNKRVKLAMASRNAGQLLSLINQLLDLSKFEAGQMTLRASQQNIVPLLKRLVSSFDSWAAQKKIALQFETSHDEIRLWYEQDKIEKVMYNLLSNALKFTREGGIVKVAVALGSSSGALHGAQPATAAATAAEITVRDSGIGIPHDRLPHIFDRFFQIDSSQTREFEGTGIGLALAQELVQIHGGGIAVQSTEGFGTTFVVSLPFGKDHLKPEQMAEGKEQGAEGREQITVESGDYPVTRESYLEPSIESERSGDPGFSGQPATSDQSERSGDPASSGQPATSSDFILIVEDNVDMRAFIGESLQDGYRIVEAANGEEGFIKAQEYIPDLIITDVMMPRVDGYEMTRRIRQDQITSHIPIIMLTARAADEDKFEGLEQGVDAYLTKPFNKKELQIRVRKLIEMRRQLRQQAGTKAVLTPTKIEASSLDQQFLQRIQQIIEENLENEEFNVDVLAAKTGVGQRQLQRKLKALTDSSPQQCIRTMRLQRARQLLEQGAGTVSEIAFRVCYGTVAAFSEAFREEFGEPPSAVKPKKGK